MEIKRGKLMGKIIRELETFIRYCPCDKHQDGISYQRGCPRCQNAIDLLAETITKKKERKL